MSTATTIPGELFLLLTNDAGRQHATQYRRHALAAGAVAELALRERIALDEGRNPRVEVLDRTPTGETVLDRALEVLIEMDGKKLHSILSARKMNLADAIGEELALVGAVERKDGLFGTSWPVADPEAERALRARLVHALEVPSDASLQDGLVLGIVRALRIAYRVMSPDLQGVGRRDLDKRIQALANDHPVAVALRRVMDSMNAAIAAG